MLSEPLDDLRILLKFLHQGADDRTLAILYVSYIEKYLAIAISANMPGLNHDLREKLFKPDGLLGSIAAKNDIAKAMGILNATDFSNLKKLASIRNLFAHQVIVSSFSNKEILKRVSDLRFIRQSGDKKDTVYSVGSGDYDFYAGETGIRWEPKEYKALSPREMFSHIALAFCLMLHGYAVNRVPEQGQQ